MESKTIKYLVIATTILAGLGGLSAFLTYLESRKTKDISKRIMELDLELKNERLLRAKNGTANT